MKRALYVLVILTLLFFSPVFVEARSIYSPLDTQPGFESLVYGSSSPWDVQRVMGAPDEIIHGGQMFPIIQNFYYHDKEGGKGATAFVFENGFLVGLIYRSASYQYMDLSYLLTNNGDRWVNAGMNAGYRGYIPYLPLYGY